jgi:hypothetical protein
MESALLAEARARPDACAKALDKAAALVEEAIPTGPPAGVEPDSGILVEDALAKSLARFEDSLLQRARSESGSLALVRADKTVSGMQDAEAVWRVPRTSEVGKRSGPRARPASAPLVHSWVPDGGSRIRIRQRAYDEKRAGRKRQEDEHAYARPEPEVFDAGAAFNHCFKPVRVRRDENGRLQPRVSNRLMRMSMPTFMGLPVEPMCAPALDWGAIAREATHLVWTKAKDALAPNEASMTNVGLAGILFFQLARKRNVCNFVAYEFQSLQKGEKLSLRVEYR